MPAMSHHMEEGHEQEDLAELLLGERRRLPFRRKGPDPGEAPVCIGVDGVVRAVPHHYLQGGPCARPIIFLNHSLNLVKLTELMRMSSATRADWSYKAMSVGSLGHSQGVLHTMGNALLSYNIRICATLFVQGFVEQAYCGLKHYKVNSRGDAQSSGMTALEGRLNAGLQLASMALGVQVSIINSEDNVVCSGEFPHKSMPQPLGFSQELDAKPLAIPLALHSFHLEPVHYRLASR